jgi:hypothetical protein
MSFGLVSLFEPLCLYWAFVQSKMFDKSQVCVRSTPSRHVEGLLIVRSFLFRFIRAVSSSRATTMVPAQRKTATACAVASFVNATARVHRHVGTSSQVLRRHSRLFATGAVVTCSCVFLRLLPSQAVAARNRRATEIPVLVSRRCANAILTCAFVVRIPQSVVTTFVSALCDSAVLP